MHERNQKILCRGAFFALCVAPTLGFVGWIGLRCLPWHEIQWERRLSAALEFDVDLQGASEPRPQILRADQLTLSTRQSKQKTAELHGVEARFSNGRLMVTARRLVVHGDALPVACRDAAERLARWRVATELRVEEVELVVADEVVGPSQATSATLLTSTAVSASGKLVAPHGHGAPPKLTQLMGRWTPASEQSPHQLQLVVQAASSADARHDGAPAVVPWSMEWKRKGGEMPLDEVHIHVAHGPFPLRWLVNSAPTWGNLAPATFAGKVHLQTTLLESRGVVTGTLSEIPLEKFLGRPALHGMTGATDVTLERLAWRGSRLKHASGSLHVGQGTMSRQLWQACIDRLGCKTPTVSSRVSPREAQSAQIPFDQVACDFQFDEQGLRLQGACRADVEGAMVVHNERALLIQPPATLHAGAWVHFLVPNPAPPGWMPATQAAVETARRLPLP